jgi:plasmid maintenance system antidote protein VapI
MSNVASARTTKKKKRSQHALEVRATLTDVLRAKLTSMPDVSQGELARITGIPTSSISRFINGSGLSLTHADTLLSYFKIVLVDENL